MVTIYARAKDAQKPFTDTERNPKTEGTYTTEPTWYRRSTLRFRANASGCSNKELCKQKFVSHPLPFVGLSLAGWLARDFIMVSPGISSSSCQIITPLAWHRVQIIHSYGARGVGEVFNPPQEWRNRRDTMADEETQKWEWDGTH